MYPESPAKRRWGIHRASILPPRGAFAVRSPRIMHGAQILPSPDGLGPCAGVPTPPSASPIPHTLPLRKNEAAKLAKNFAKRVILTPQTRFRRLSGEICSKRVPRLLLSARFEYVSRSPWHRPANSAYVWAKSRPIGAETPFEKQKCTRKSKSSPRARACGTHQHHRMPHALPLRGKRTYNVPTYNWQRLAARVRRCLVAAGE